MPELPGPTGPIPYERDEWGYPTIRARNASEGLWARGYLHAVDRPLQVAIALRVAEGRLMETVGDNRFTRLVDRATRSLGLTHDLDAVVARLPPHVRSFLHTYCDGFNAGRVTHRRPVVSRVLGLDKLTYTPRDVVLMYRMTAWFGLTSSHHTATLVLGELLTHGASPELLDLLLGEGAKGIDFAAFRDVDWPQADGMPGLSLLGGSNCFAVSGERSATGKPLLMSEFHMQIARLPPVLWAFSVQWPGGEHSGVCIPGLPFVSAGRSRKLAWGYTFGHADMFELSVETVRGRERKTATGWEPLRRRDEVVRTGMGRTETWTYWDFDGGTLLGHGGEPAEVKRAALRWRGLRDTGSDIEAFWDGLHTDSAIEFAQAHRRVKNIAIAGTAADSDGHIAYVQTGRVCAGREGAVMRRPEVADGPDLDESHRPFVVDPACGWIASANEAHPGWTAFSEPRYRHERLVELLSGLVDVRPDDLLRISYDELDGCARRLLPIWAPLLPDGADARAMVAWAGGGASQSPEDRRLMGLFHALHGELLRALLVEQAGEGPAAVFCDELSLLLPFHDRLDDVLALQEPQHLDAAALRELIARVWSDAVNKASSGRATGPVTTAFKNIVTEGRLPSLLGFSTPALELPGGPTSLFQARRMTTMGNTLVGGPAFHVLVDLSQPGIRYNIAGGASGRRFGPGYGAGIEAWRTGELKELGG